MAPTEPTDAAPLRPGRGRLTAVFVAVIVIGLGVGAVTGPGDDTDPLVGSPAPEVVIEGFDGSEWRLSDHLSRDGRPVVLNLWASWCAPCRDEIPELDAFAASNPGIMVVGAAVNDTPMAAAALAGELQPGYLVGIDATGRLRDRYPSFGMPFTVVIDRTGIIRHTFAGGVRASQIADVFD
jgi:cytochrome c biogenesis protein CcmG/thiol:disulfide interchange protein DsbE